LQRLDGGGDFLFHHDAPGFIQHAVATGAISQVQADGQVGLRKSPALLQGCSAKPPHDQPREPSPSDSMPPPTLGAVARVARVERLTTRFQFR